MRHSALLGDHGQRIIGFLDKVGIALLYVFVFSAGISRGVMNTALGLVVIITVFRFMISAHDIKLDWRILKPLGIFFAAELVSLAFAYDRSSGLRVFFSDLYHVFPLVLAMVFVKSQNQIMITLNLLCASVLIVDGYVFWQKFHGVSRPGGFLDPITLGGFLAIMIPLFIIMASTCIRSNSKVGVLYFGTAMFSVAPLLLSGTRGAWLALFAVCLLCFASVVRQNVKHAIAIVLVLVITGVMLDNVSYIQQRFYSAADLNMTSNAARIQLWQGGISMFVSNPVTGVGLGNFQKIYYEKYDKGIEQPKNKSTKQPKKIPHNHAHNNLIQILAETGIIGLSAFIYLFGGILINAYRRLKESPHSPWPSITVVVTIGFLTHGMVDYTFGLSTLANLYWFIIGIGYVSCRMETLSIPPSIESGSPNA